MLRFRLALVLLGVLVVEFLAFNCLASDPPRPSEGEIAPYCRVEMVGRFVAAEKVQAPQAVFETGDLRFLVEPAEGTRLPADKNAGWYQVVGTLEATKDFQSPGPSLLCHATSIRQAAWPADEQGDEQLLETIKEYGSALVVYRAGRADIVRSLCESLGLRIVEQYGPGRFFVCSWPTDIDLSAVLNELRKSKDVDHVVPNMTATIGPPKRPQRP